MTPKKPAHTKSASRSSLKPSDRRNFESKHGMPFPFAGMGIPAGGLQAEEEIRRLNQKLEQRGFGHTAEIKATNIELNNEIHERKQAEDKLREQRDLLETILKQAVDGIVVCDESGRIIFVNEAARQMTLGDPMGAGIHEAERIWGKAFDYDGRLLPLGEWPLSKALKGETTNNKRIRMVRPGGSFYDILISGAPLRAPDQHIMGAVSTFSDITQRTKAEEEIKKLNKDLVRRTAELEMANKELEAFTYSVSHDLKAPLIVASGFCRRLSEFYSEKLDAKGNRYVQRLQEACQQMTLLIEDLLQLSKVTVSAMKFKLVDLSEIVKSITEQLKETQPERDVSFFIEEGVAARGDPRLLRIALENLIGNAWKFTSHCYQGTIEFGLTKVGEDLTYFVRDNGCGFDISLADKLFKPFQRLHRHEEFSGTGVGLATVHRIITRHGGRTWAESAVGKGATFFFTLPS